MEKKCENEGLWAHKNSECHEYVHVILWENYMNADPVQMILKSCVQEITISSLRMTVLILSKKHRHKKDFINRIKIFKSLFGINIAVSVSDVDRASAAPRRSLAVARRNDSSELHQLWSKCRLYVRNNYWKLLFLQVVPNFIKTLLSFSIIV